MVLVQPPVEEIKEKIPNASAVTYVDAGAYKLVYRISLGSDDEALKLVPLSELDTGVAEEQEAFYERLKRELNILAECTCLSTVRLGSLPPSVWEFSGGGKYLAYTEEFLPGQNLKNVIGGGYLPTDKELAAFIRDMLRSLQELWNNSEKVIHRDVKPQNIIKTSLSQRPFVLLDLGLALSLNEPFLTKNPRARPGTVPYLPPECFTCSDLEYRQHLDWRRDLYSLGLTAYEFAVGKNPFFEADWSEERIIKAILSSEHQPVSDARKGFPEELSSLISKLMRRKQFLRGTYEEALTVVEKYI